MSNLNEALRLFEASEANLTKLDKLWGKIRGHLGSDIAFGSPPGYDEACLAFRQILRELPAIDGYRIEDRLHDYYAVGQMRFDAAGLGDVEAKVAVEGEIDAQQGFLREYRFRLLAKRRALVRERVQELIIFVDREVNAQLSAIAGVAQNETLPEDRLEPVRSSIKEIDTLLGSGTRPSRWSELRRLSFAKTVAASRMPFHGLRDEHHIH
jgi:hypothetical protein